MRAPDKWAGILQSEGVGKMDQKTPGKARQCLGKQRRLHIGMCSGAQIHLKIIGLSVEQDPARNKREQVFWLWYKMWYKSSTLFPGSDDFWSLACGIVLFPRCVARPW